MTLKFGTDGIRGPVETHMTPEACLKIGHATGLVMKEQGWDTVMIGKDTRVSLNFFSRSTRKLKFLLFS